MQSGSSRISTEWNVRSGFTLVREWKWAAQRWKWLLVEAFRLLSLLQDWTWNRRRYQGRSRPPNGPQRWLRYSGGVLLWNGLNIRFSVWKKIVQSAWRIFLWKRRYLQNGLCYPEDAVPILHSIQNHLYESSLFLRRIHWKIRLLITVF